MMTMFPWHAFQWQLLVGLLQNKRLPHALLLVGQSGLEENIFAENFAKLVLCRSVITAKAGMTACGQCHSCRLVQAKSHPDFLTISPDKADGPIKIDQIRELVSAAQETAMQGRHRVIIITKAHMMNLSAANALLKTLEEPAKETLLILVSEQNQRLPATILSRCRKIFFNKPDTQQALQWLAPLCDNAELLLNLADGSPTNALQLAKSDFLAQRQQIYEGLLALSDKKANPLSLSAAWLALEIPMIYRLLLTMLRDMLRYKLLPRDVPLINSDFYTLFANLTAKIQLKNLLSYLDVVQREYKNFMMSQSLNKQLLLEELLIRWVYVSR